MVENTRFSSCEVQAQRCKHRALTGFVRKKWNGDAFLMQHIFYDCDVVPYFGALPPELRARVKQDAIAEVTRTFRMDLEDFLVQNAFQIEDVEKDYVWDLPHIGAMFGCSCTLEMRGVTIVGVSPWEGVAGVVCKMSFPEIKAEYALKVYKSNSEHWFNHGPWFEIATAFAANRAEPKDNNPVYMGSLIYNKYLLSKWAGEPDNKPVRKNKNPVYCTSDEENEPRNLRAGRRIDWGETELTEYGTLSYRGRKLYRQIANLDMTGVVATLGGATNNLQRRELNRAIATIRQQAFDTGNRAVQMFLDRVKRVR